MKPVRATMEVDAELRAANAQVQLVRYRFDEPPQSVMHVDDHIRVELCLGPRHRSARACFSDHWDRSRFERIGDLFVVPPTLDMVARSDEDRPLSSVLCQLKLEPIVRLFDELPEFSDHYLLACLDIRDLKLRNLLLRLAEEARHPGFASAVLVEALATQLSVELLRYGGAVPEQRPASRGLAAWQLRRIDERLSEVRAAPDLSELAALCGLSVRQLTRSFRAARGCSVGTHVATLQIAHARALLAAGDSITATARTLGFASSSNFCQAFRRATGVTPGQYRRQQQGR